MTEREMEAALLAAAEKKEELSDEAKEIIKRHVDDFAKKVQMFHNVVMTIVLVVVFGTAYACTPQPRYDYVDSPLPAEVVYNMAMDTLTKQICIG
jgi:hypothetical protein